METSERVWAVAVKHLFVGALGRRLTPACRERLREAGLELERPLAPSYPLARWKGFLHIAAVHLWPGVLPEAAYYAMGRRFAQARLETLGGRALLPLLRLAGPGRTLSLAGGRLASLTSSGEARLVSAGPGTAELWMNDVLAHVPTFAAGALVHALESVGAHQALALPEGFDGQSATYRLRWREQPAPLGVPLGVASTGRRSSGAPSRWP